MGILIIKDSNGRFISIREEAQAEYINAFFVSKHSQGLKAMPDNHGGITYFDINNREVFISILPPTHPEAQLHET